MDRTNTYKALMILFAIIAIVFAALYFTSKNDVSLSDTYEGISTDIRNCSERVAEWRAENSNKATTTPAERADLEDILADCEETIRQNQ